MIVRQVRIPEPVIAGLIRFITESQSSIDAVTGEATRLLLSHRITDPERVLPRELAAKMIRRHRPMHLA